MLSPDSSTVSTTAATSVASVTAPESTIPVTSSLVTSSTSSSSSSTTPLSTPTTQEVAEPGTQLEGQTLPPGHNTNNASGYTNEENQKELRAVSSNFITVSALPAHLPQESTVSSPLGTFSTTVPTPPSAVLPRCTSPSASVEASTQAATTTATATAAPSTRPPSRISLDQFSGERGHNAPPISHSAKGCLSPSFQSSSSSPQRVARPLSVTIDVSDTITQENSVDPPVYTADDDPPQLINSSTMPASAVLSGNSSVHQYQYHRSSLFGSGIAGLENGVDPGPGTSAYHARLSALSQQSNNPNLEGVRPTSSSLSWRSPPSLWSRERAPGVLPNGSDMDTGRDNGDDDPTLLPSTSSAAMPLAMFRRPFLEEDELPEYMSLPEQGLPFKIPAVQSITYTVIPSQGPDEFQQPQEHEDDLRRAGRLSHEDSPIHPNPVSSSSSSAEMRLDREPSLSLQAAGPGPLLQVPIGSPLLSSPRLRQGAQSERPWTLEYWVEDTIMYLLYLMDPKHSATTSLVPRTTDVQETRSLMATATIEPTPSALRSTMAPDANSGQIEAAAPSALPRTSISSGRSRSRNGNRTSTPGTSLLSGLSSSAPHSQQHARQLSSQSQPLSPPPVTGSDSQQSPIIRSDSSTRDETAVVVAMDGISENGHLMNHHPGDGIGEEEQDDGDGIMERVPVGHIRGRPPPLTRRQAGTGWPTVNSSHVNQLSRQHRLFRRTQPSFSAAVMAPTPSSSTAPATEAQVSTTDSDVVQSPPVIAAQAEVAASPVGTEGTTSHGSENVGLEPPSSVHQINPSLEETEHPSRPPSLAPPGTIVRTTLPSVQHVHINDGYAGEEADAVLAHNLQAIISPTASAGGHGAVQRNNAFNNALTSEFFKHPSFAFVTADDPQTWIWWSTHHESNLQRCRQEGPMEEVMMWWRTRLDYRTKENKKKRRLEKQRRKELGLDDEVSKATKNLGLVARWKRYLSLESTQHRQSMEITMRVRGLYYAWREEEVIAAEAELLMQQQQQQQQQNLSLLSPPPPADSPPPISFHSDGGQDFVDGVSEDQSSQFGMTSIRPRSSTTPPPPPLPMTPPPQLPPMPRKTKSRFFQLVRDDSLVMGQRVKGGPVAEVWITEEADEEEVDEFQGYSGPNISGSSHHQQDSGEGYVTSPTYQSVLDSSQSSPAPFVPLVRSDRSSSVTSNNGNTFMTDVSAATGGPVRSSTMSGPGPVIRPVPSGRSYASSSRYPLSDMDTPAPSFRDAMNTTGGASSGYYGPGNGGHASSHRRQRSSVAFSSSRASSIAPTVDDLDHDVHHHHQHHHLHHHHHHPHHPHDGPRQSNRRTGDDDTSSSSFPRSLRRRKCTIRVMKSLNNETSTFVLSTGPRLPELFDLFTDQSVPGPSRGAFICSVVTFALIFLIIFISLAFTHRGGVGDN
ncbi:hypothetical protein EMPS_06906 [Entomortierella parvispora]|uniref:Uncharacterized protein n=1 Tax=Entomortierella parvispora TaxID=205924 RepID=A0A9P3HDL6_9FUNG|nr:hypothetical protein EMPS_06906 [Entomortierella parvispora]